MSNSVYSHSAALSALHSGRQVLCLRPYAACLARLPATDTLRPSLLLRPGITDIPPL